MTGGLFPFSFAEQEAIHPVGGSRQRKLNLLVFGENRGWGYHCGMIQSECLNGCHFTAPRSTVVSISSRGGSLLRLTQSMAYTFIFGYPFPLNSFLSRCAYCHTISGHIANQLVCEAVNLSAGSTVHCLPDTGSLSLK